MVRPVYMLKNSVCHDEFLHHLKVCCYFRNSYRSYVMCQRSTLAEYVRGVCWSTQRLHNLVGLGMKVIEPVNFD
ncbi:hypothetical protein JTE90_023545 [Oedothorax gibbosus]|uniref:Uncharacterized protein n=1 Tax=Oedothorax gibbosus TaxID=931172 RepID=A0AAV6UMR0_9ARAC|nr:hypothetical protein JTE90_023545 [Oedothorax gibbosus]